MTGIHIIRAISVKGAIPIQSQLSDHQKLTLTTIYKVLSWYLVMVICMYIDFFNKCIIRKLTLTFLLSNTGMYEQ